MVCVSSKPFGRRDGKHLVQAVIVSDDTPAALPVTGENVAGLTADDVFAPFSVLYVVSPAAAHQIYIADESGAFVAQ